MIVVTAGELALVTDTEAADVSELRIQTGAEPRTIAIELRPADGSAGAAVNRMPRGHNFNLANPEGHVYYRKGKGATGLSP